MRLSLTVIGNSYGLEYTDPAWEVKTYKMLGQLITIGFSGGFRTFSL